jgi:hypothetical protein
MGIEPYILLFLKGEFVDHTTGAVSRKELSARLHPLLEIR